MKFEKLGDKRMDLILDINYLRLFSNFYNRSYLIDFINKKDNKIKKALISSNNNISAMDCFQNYTYAEFFNCLYQIIKRDYRCEYIYLNEMFINEILRNHDIQHSIITELYVNSSQADLVVVNGTTTIYEIKTELDSLSRLSKQLNDYIQVFDKVYVVTYRQMLEKLYQLLESESKFLGVGIQILNDDGRLEMIKPSISHKRFFDQKLMFDILTKKEYILLNSDYYEARDIFTNLTIEEAHQFFKSSLFSREKKLDYISELPISLKLAGFKIQNQLNKKQKNKFYDKLNCKIKEDL